MKGVTIEIGADDGVVLATLGGEIDLLNCDEVGHELRAAALAGGAGMVTDLSAVRYADSNGVRMLFVLARELTQSRINWTVALNESSPLRRLFKVTTFDEIVPILPSVEEALAALAERPHP
jgi:anti-anti-sigma factor